MFCVDFDLRFFFIRALYALAIGFSLHLAAIVCYAKPLRIIFNFYLMLTRDLVAAVSYYLTEIFHNLVLWSQENEEEGYIECSITC